ncbi:hypothetical protein PHYSODRAFT_331735 [Phytophthora sojae]|uniref:HAT C-terminal dimerisation domain-containing protein n=1 Tax=Phytophthora sojae (strain P6497) TaxID=1094619 RepID=G4ZCS3_PHYSP|nr:hypothetical protein PHYSODRAFT_331735 [Phytophthora sojae]EGZ17805.1 hypothetical protein PHYSODRAFT_331735 [Phytophthora sojae]|eukprot:XP_009526863.1 hypothetical protein PHYSODRAFT_331735 [Phytophthora sojae]
MTNSAIFTADEYEKAREQFADEMFVLKKKSAVVHNDAARSQSPEKRMTDATDRARQSFHKMLYGSRTSRSSAATDDKLKTDCEWELSSYLKQSSEAEVKDPDKPPSALSWWKQNHSKFPTIAVLTRK